MADGSAKYKLKILDLNDLWRPLTRRFNVSTIGIPTWSPLNKGQLPIKELKILKQKSII